jgi:putative oxidoreductase
MRSTLLFGARVVVEGYLAVHGAQKLFGAFGGPGLAKAAAGFERIGLAPGRQMAALAGAAEPGGGLLTVAGAADPAGPLAIIGTMAVASATHRANGPLARDGGFELPLTNLAAAAALAAAGPGRFRAGPALPRPAHPPQRLKRRRAIPSRGQPPRPGSDLIVDAQPGTPSH